jgi:fluoride exporter
LSPLGPVAFAAIGLGAAFGAWLRYLLSLWLNPVSPALPLGTLAANLGGGFVIGAAVAYLGAHEELSPAWRLFIVTGFLGGLTTFSTFSAESMLLLLEGRALVALLHSAAHLFGALACCFAGYELARRVLL